MAPARKTSGIIPIRLSSIAATLGLFAAMLLGATVFARSAHAQGTYDNALIATDGDSHLGENPAPGGGQCKAFANAMVKAASGNTQSPSGYQTGWSNLGVAVSSADAAKGDIIQITPYGSTDGTAESVYFAHMDAHGNSPAAYKLHTAIIITNNGGGSFKVVDANFTSTNTVGEHNFSPFTWAAGSIVDIWRLGTVVGGGTTSSGPPPIPPTTSSEDSAFGGDFNGDRWNDSLIIHQRSDGGADVHMLYGNAGGNMFANTTTFVQSLPASAGWDWSKMKFAVGRFNDDQYADLAILTQRADGGADIHMLYGGATGYVFATVAFVRSLPASDGWSWSKMKVVSGDFNGDNWDDIAIAHQRADGGADIHVLYGNAGVNMFANPTTFVRSLPASDGWSWSKMKLAAGPFNDDQYADLAIVHQSADGGADVHMLYGGANGYVFAYANTFVRNLPASAGWDWSKMKLAAGDFNGDKWADLAIIHERSDFGADVHVLYGNVGVNMFANTTTFAQSLPGSAGWNWWTMKFSTGPFNDDQYYDLGVFPDGASEGIDVHMLYGGASGYVFATEQYIRSLLASAGWNWNLADIV